MDQLGAGARDIDRLLGDARRLLAEVRSAAPADAGLGDLEELRGEAEAADGLIRATVGIGGRLESLRADPRAMRLGSEALCEEIMVAVNGALDDLQAKARQAGPAVPDRAALDRQLEELQSESVRRMEMFTQGVAEAIDGIMRASEGRHGR